jgi:hypothetical protein
MNIMPQNKASPHQNLGIFTSHWYQLGDKSFNSRRLSLGNSAAARIVFVTNFCYLMCGTSVAARYPDVTSWSGFGLYTQCTTPPADGSGACYGNDLDFVMNFKIF